MHCIVYIRQDTCLPQLVLGFSGSLDSDYAIRAPYLRTCCCNFTVPETVASYVPFSGGSLNSASKKKISQSRITCRALISGVVVQIQDKDRHIEALSKLVQAAEDQTADAMKLVGVLKQQRDSKPAIGLSTVL